MIPPELYEKFFGLLVAVMAVTGITTLFSWKLLDALIDVIIKEFKQGKKLGAFLTVLTAAGMVLVVIAATAGVWLGYRYLHPEAMPPEPPKPAEPQIVSVPTPTPTPTPNSTPGVGIAFRRRNNSGRQPQTAPTGPVQTASATTAPQTNREPVPAPTAPGPTPQTPSAEPKLQIVPPQGQVCPAPQAPATIIIPPGEPPSEPDQLV